MKVINPLNISKKQIKTLEIMIKKLFPEFVYVKVDEYQIDGGGPAVVGISFRNAWPVFCFLSEIEKPPHDDCRAIPWFEFCIHQLPKRIFEETVKQKKVEKDEYEDWLYDDMSWLNNPIDYFYYFFKKLNL